MTQSHDSHQPPKGHILVAEDDHIGQLAVKQVLRQSGYKANFVADGKSAISALQSNHYDLVVMDCLMPQMDGFEVARFIRDSRSHRINSEIPIIALTGLSGEEDQRRCRAAGMDLCVAKPVNSDTLIAAIEQCLGSPENNRPARDKLQSTQLQKDAFLGTVIDSFLKEVPLVITDLQRAIKGSDLVRLQNIGHRLRGAADILQAATLSSRSQALEDAGKKEDLTLASKLALQLINELRKLSAALTE